MRRRCGIVAACSALAVAGAVPASAVDLSGSYIAEAYSIKLISSEATSLAGGVVTFRNNRVAVRGSVEEGTLKNDQAKVVTIDKATVATLTEHRRSQVEARLASRAWVSEDYVFTNRIGEPLPP